MSYDRGPYLLPVPKYEREIPKQIFSFSGGVPLVNHHFPAKGLTEFLGNVPTADAPAVVPNEVNDITSGRLDVLGQLPNVGDGIQPQDGLLSFLGQLPNIGDGIQPLSGLFDFLGQLPTKETVEPVIGLAGLFSFLGQLPTAEQPGANEVTALAGRLDVLGQVPNVGDGVQPFSGLVEFLGRLPTAFDITVESPTAGRFELLGQVPNIGEVIQPFSGLLDFLGQLPTKTTTEAAAPTAGLLEFFGQLPNIGDGVSPSTGLTEFLGQVPLKQEVAAPSLGLVEFLGQLPSVSASTFANPSAGLLEVRGQLSTVVRGPIRTANPSKGLLRLIGGQPATALSGSTAEPSQGLLSFIQQRAQSDSILGYGISPVLLPAAYRVSAFNKIIPTLPLKNLFEIGGQLPTVTRAGTTTKVPAKGLLEFLGGLTETGGIIIAAASPVTGSYEINGTQAFAQPPALVSPSSGLLEVLNQLPTTASEGAVKTPPASLFELRGGLPSLDTKVVAPSAGLLSFLGNEEVRDLNYRVSPILLPGVYTDFNRTGLVQVGLGSLETLGQLPTVVRAGNPIKAPVNGLLEVVGQVSDVSNGIATVDDLTTGSYQINGGVPLEGAVTPLAGLFETLGQVGTVSNAQIWWTHPRWWSSNWWVSDNWWYRFGGAQISFAAPGHYNLTIQGQAPTALRVVTKTPPSNLLEVKGTNAQLTLPPIDVTPTTGGLDILGGVSGAALGADSAPFVNQYQVDGNLATVKDVAIRLQTSKGLYRFIADVATVQRSGTIGKTVQLGKVSLLGNQSTVVPGVWSLVSPQTDGWTDTTPSTDGWSDVTQDSGTWS